MNSAHPTRDQVAPANRKLIWFGAIFALLYPTLMTWGYFVYSAQFPTGLQQTIYAIGKSIQFVFPIVWVWAVLREPLVQRRPSLRGVPLGAAFGAAVVGASWIMFNFFLRDTSVFAAAASMIRDRLASIGIDTLAKYILLGVFYSLFHSLLEEYFWRWFAFGQLRRVMRLWPAIILSALAFMGHHVVILGKFFENELWIGLLLSFAVAIGGVFWAWLYDRTGSLLGPWLSHLMIDAGIFWVGYELIGDRLSAGFSS
jgi:membrane protease YdiL (CAAX protease family)